jgi:hypothetical protein
VSVFRPQLSAFSSLRFQSLDEKDVEGGVPLERDAAFRPPRSTPRQAASPQRQGQEPRALPTTHAIHIDEAASVEDGAVGRGLVEPGERERGSMLEGDTPQPRSALRFSHHYDDDHHHQEQQQQHYEEEESCVTSTSHTEDPPAPLPAAAAAAAAAANSSVDSRSGRQVKGASTDVTHRQQGIVVPVEVYSEQQETIRVLRLQVSELQRELGVLKLQLHQQHRQEGVSDKVFGAIDGDANSDGADDNNDVDDHAFKDVDFDGDNGKSQKQASLVYSSEPFRSEKSPNYEHEYEHEDDDEEDDEEEGGAMFMEAPSLLDLSQFVLLRGPTGANAQSKPHHTISYHTVQSYTIPHRIIPHHTSHTILSYTILF